MVLIKMAVVGKIVVLISYIPYLKMDPVLVIPLNLVAVLIVTKLLGDQINLVVDVPILNLVAVLILSPWPQDLIKKVAHVIQLNLVAVLMVKLRLKVLT